MNYRNTILPVALMIFAISQGEIRANPTMGLQAWTFRSSSFFETVDQAAKLGVTCIEAFPSQKLGGGLAGKMGPAMTEEERRAVQEKLAAAKIILCSFGVANAPDEKHWREIFEFGKEMGLRWLTIEPPVGQLPLLDRLSREYHLPLAIHNHGPPSPYADPAVTSAILAKYPANIGICGDTGHWARAGHDPVKAIALFPDRIVALHFKDVAAFQKSARDVPLGTGASHASMMLEQLRRQNFNGVFLIEYEYSSPQLAEEVAQCVAYLDRNIGKPAADSAAADRQTPEAK